MGQVRDILWTNLGQFWDKIRTTLSQLGMALGHFRDIFETSLGHLLFFLGQNRVIFGAQNEFLRLLGERTSALCAAYGHFDYV